MTRFETRNLGHICNNSDIVKAHGDELTVETRVGDGSEFVVSLPPYIVEKELLKMYRASGTLPRVGHHNRGLKSAVTKCFEPTALNIHLNLRGKVFLVAN
jgi:hypothetical protein